MENINGGTYSNGTLFVTTNGGEGTNPAVVAIEVETGESRVVVDNYFGMGLKCVFPSLTPRTTRLMGSRCSSLNDIVADSQGNLIFKYAFLSLLSSPVLLLRLLILQRRNLRLSQRCQPSTP